MNITFNFSFDERTLTYTVYIQDDVFAHLSEGSLVIFRRMCLKSGNKIIRRV